MSGLLGRLALAVAFLAAVSSLTLDSSSPPVRAEAVYVVKLALLVGVAVSGSAPRRWGWIAILAVLGVTAMVVLPPGPARPALVTAGLATVFVLASLGAIRDPQPASAGALFARLLPLAFGAQVLLRPELALGSLAQPRVLMDLLVWPVLAAACLAPLARAWSLPLAAAVAALVAPLAPGWGAGSVVALGVLAVAGRLLSGSRLSLPAWVSKVAAAVAAPAFLAASLLAAYPWARERPLAAAVALAARGLPGPPSLVVLEGREVALAARETRVGADLADPAVAEVVIDSRLANSASLPAGTVVATFRLRDAAGREHPFALRAGRETGEWAARRADVAALPGFVAPPAFRLEVDAAGGLFGSTYRARWRLPSRLAAKRIEVTRGEGLPEDLVIAISRVELRP